MTSLQLADYNPILHIDLETFSSVDIKNGVYKYAESSDFQILLFAYAYGDDPVTVLDLASGDELPMKIIMDLTDPCCLKMAHNAQFERVCLSRYMRDNFESVPGDNFLDPEGWYCTMVHSSMCGLPSSLKQVGDALGLAEDQKKLTIGQQLIRYFCIPCKPTKANGGRTRNLPHHAPDKWQMFIDYNRQDVVTERAIEESLYGIYTMPETELKRYWTDQKINDSGIGVDMEMVRSILNYGQIHSQNIAEQAEKLSGVNVQSIKQLKEWIQERTGIELTSLTKPIVSELVKTVKDPVVKEVLQLRQEAGKLSVKKYEVFDKAVTNDGRIHGCFQFYGSRTGRFAGRLVQPQNLPRNSFDDFDTARRMVKGKMWEMLETCYDSVNDVFSTLIRTALVPPAGCAYAVADYSAIEARVIAWLADEQWRLSAFHNGKDIYCESASQMFHVPVEKHGANAHLRKQGKIAELALGYGGGVNALKAFGADKMGMTDTDMADIVAKWRKASPAVCGLWKTMENMVDKALKGWPEAPGPKGMACTYLKDVNALRIRLPSGRCLIYQHPRYESEPGFGKRFCFDGLNQTTRKWETVYTWGGKLTENVIQAIARDCLCTTIDRMQQFTGCPIVMHIHDEIVVEVPADAQKEWLDKILDVMAEPLDWAPGLELVGAGFTADYYQKD